jgi:excisionase family DNA binding protein
MQIEIPDTVIDALRESLAPILDRLIEERVEQRRPLLLSVTQVAEELNCSRASVFGLIRGGHLEAIRTGRSYRVATANFHEYVEELTKPSYDREVVSARTRPQQRLARLEDATRESVVRHLLQPSSQQRGHLALPVPKRTEGCPRRRSMTVAAPWRNSLNDGGEWSRPRSC